MSVKRVAVLLGGRSPEREVSLVSGRACAKALREEGFDAVEIDAGRDLADRLHKTKPDAAFNALHGRWGEDGCVQGLLEMMEIPYTHSGVLASALAMHKERAKAVFRCVGLPLAESVVVDRKVASQRHVRKPPYVIKPVNQGSSVGVYIVRSGDNRPPGALGTAEWALGDGLWSKITSPAVNSPSPSWAAVGSRSRKSSPRQFYDYEAKYADESVHVVPAKLQPQGDGRSDAAGGRAHAALGCRGVSRTDFAGTTAAARTGLIVLEVNTQPV
jgi:D-alanine-D-alanine ligase